MKKKNEGMCCQVWILRIVKISSSERRKMMYVRIQDLHKKRKNIQEKISEGKIKNFKVFPIFNCLTR